MKNYNSFNGNNKINILEREEYLNYAIENGRFKPTFFPASNHNPDYITGKIGQEFKGIRKPQTYFIRKNNRILQPIDSYYIEHRNNFNDFYSLGKDYNPFQEYQNKIKTLLRNRQNNVYNSYRNYNKNNIFPINKLKYNYNINNYNQPLLHSKSMDNIDYEIYKNKINQREKLLVDNNENNYQFQNNYNINQYNLNPNNSLINEDNLNSNLPVINKYSLKKNIPVINKYNLNKNTPIINEYNNLRKSQSETNMLDYSNSYINENSFPKGTKYINYDVYPCKIYF